MKKIIAVLFICSALAVSLTGCGLRQDEKNARLTIAATIFPEADWVMNVLGEKADGAEVKLLTDTGADLHSFQPTADDIIGISRCDLFLYVGGESDAWVEDALREADNRNMIVINLLEVLGDAAREEQHVEGMEPEEGGEEEEHEYDEHVWLSLRNAAVFVAVIRDALARLDPVNADAYAANAAAYLEKLEALDRAYAAAAAAAQRKVLLFGDRFPFRYLTEDYGLEYYAAFPGCSAESEASFETIAFLAGKVDALGLPAVLTLEGSDHRIAETVISATSAKNAQILVMDSMQSVAPANRENGVTYLSVMEKNLDALKKALG